MKEKINSYPDSATLEFIYKFIFILITATMTNPLYNKPREYLGKGWAFPLQLSLQGGIKFSSEEQKVKESIWIILRTSVGERVYRPNFGSRLSELAFAPMNSETLLQIRIYVLEALEVWEPRIIVDEVRTDADPSTWKSRYYRQL